ncbi:MAG: polysaccharide deacetylase family protein [Desulfomonilia bacterium]
MNPRLFIKNIIAGLLYYSCLLDMLSIKRLSGRGFILMYHRIVRSREQYRNLIQPGMFVTEETFEKHLAFLKKKFSIITLDEMVRRIDRGQSVNRCCSITFDDGWKDTYDVAFPILKKYQVPASVFPCLRLYRHGKMVLA